MCASLGNSACVASPSTSWGVPAQSPSLSQQTATFLASGGLFQEQQSILSPSSSQSRPNFTVPSFVATFATPHSLILSTSITAGTSVPVPFRDSSLVANLPSGPLLQQPFNIMIIIIIIYSIYRALIPNGPKALYIIKITTKS